MAQPGAEYAEAIDRHIHPPIQYLMELSKGPPTDEQKDRYRSSAAETGPLVEDMRRRFVPLARAALDELVDEADQGRKRLHEVWSGYRSWVQIF